MEQHRFIFFDSSSGEILATHTHVNLDGQEQAPDRDALRQLYRSFAGRDTDVDRVDVLDVEADLLRRGLSGKRPRVDTAARQIVWPENGAGSAE